MTRTIEVDAQVEHGRVVINLPPDVPDGPLHLVVQIDSPAVPSAPAKPRVPEDLHVFNLTAWPADARFGRDELYGEDGR